MNHGVVDRAVVADLAGILDPCSERLGTPVSILDLRLVDDVVVSADTVRCTLTLTSPMCPLASPLVSQIEVVLAAHWPEHKIEVEITGDVWLPDRRALTLSSA